MAERASDAPQVSIGAPTGRSGRPDGAAGVVIRERTGLAIVAIAALRGSSRAVAERLAGSLGVAGIVDAPACVGHGAMTVAGIAPGRWLSIADDGREGSALEVQLRALLAGVAATIDQSDASVALRMSGPRVRDALAKGVAIDIDEAAFPPGSVATTSVAQVPITIVAVDEAPTFDLFVPRSLAASAWRWLEHAAAEYGCMLASPDGDTASTDRTRTV